MSEQDKIKEIYNNYSKLSEDKKLKLYSNLKTIFGKEESERIIENISQYAMASTYKDTQMQDKAPSRPLEVLDEQDAEIAQTAQDAALNVDTSTETPGNEEIGDMVNMAAANMSDEMTSVADDDITDGDGNENTAESVIRMIVQMSIFKGLRDVSEEFGKSFEVDKFAILARFQKYLLNQASLDKASESVVNLIKQKKQEQEQNRRMEMAKEMQKSNEK